MSKGKAVLHSNSSTFPTGAGKKAPGYSKTDNLISLDAAAASAAELCAQGDGGKIFNGFKTILNSRIHKVLNSRMVKK